MRKFKLIDLWISIMLILGFTIIDIFERDGDFLTNHVLLGYFIVGGWQVLSMLIHAYNHWFTSGKGRRYIYNWITFLALITMPAGSIWILLFAAPFMAIYYTWLCHIEVYVKMQRPLALLK